ncbi:DUF7935 family protein [Saccharicrinis aurantiacus]|uniref:DUF7935 family protein n=1 Tax=Saccharicrinis aurantiacus TaxID=1849719 RepID=UPI00094F6B8B|nr:hypothetical protein [Saccharicrinis aurantiacus]
METFLDIINWLLPSLIVLIVTLVLVRWFLKAETQRRKQEFLLMRNKDLLPIKMSAYERVTLFLERISAESIVMREQSKAVTSKDFQSVLLGSIRTEYEHNMAMQVHISPDTWHLVKNAKEEMIRTINISATMVEPEHSSMGLAKTILEQFPNTTSYHFKKALDGLKADVQTFYS